MRTENENYQRQEKPQPATYTQRHNNTRRLESHGSIPPIDAKSIAQRQSIDHVDKSAAARRVKKIVIPAFPANFRAGKRELCFDMHDSEVVALRPTSRLCQHFQAEGEDGFGRQYHGRE